MYYWQHYRPYNSYNEYFRNIFGSRVQKLTINAGFTCPNRDGRVGIGGCTYCLNEAFNPSYCNPEKSITKQLEEGIDFHHKRYRRATKYLAYFQAYTNTYAELEDLKLKYEEALRFPQVIGLVIGTRPDCMDEAKLEYLSRLSEKYYIIIEYGIESCRNSTLQKINRGHDFECSVKMLQLTKSYHLKTGGHFIFGLPGETPQTWLEDVSIISELPLDTIKFHQLQLIKGTLMEEEYQLHPDVFYRFTLESYIQFIVDFAERLNPEFVIERFAGEVPPRYLSESHWGIIRYEQLINHIYDEFEKRHSYQGIRWNSKT